MAGEKNDCTGSSGSSLKNVIKKTPPAKKSTGKNILRFETLISGFSASLIRTPEENLENELNSWLERFVTFLRVDRCVVNEFSEDEETVHRLLNYTVPDIDIAPVVDSYRPPEGSVETMKKGILIKAEKIPEDLPPGFRGGVIEKTNTKSIVIAPLAAGNKVIGSLLLASYRKRRKWPEDTIRRIKLIGEIIANAILRIRSHKSLFQEMERREMLEEKYTTILKNANVGFFLADYGYNILYANDEYCRMSGYSRDELYSKKIYELLVPVPPDEEKRVSEEIAATGATHHETTHIKKDGSLIDLDVSSTVLDEHVFFSFMRDITEQNQLKKEREERVGFEALVSDFSATLISIKLDDLVNELEKWIIRFVSFLDIGRGIISEYEYDRNAIKVIVNYTAPAAVVEVSPHDTELTAADAVMDELKRGTMIRAEKIPEDLQAPFRGWIIEKHNTKSLVVVPLISEDRIIGNLTFASYRKERKWPDYIFSRIKLIGEIIANSILRLRAYEALNRAQKELEERLEFEEVISEFSTALINIKPDDIKDELGKWLTEFVALIDADRCAVNEYGEGQKTIKNLMQYTVPEFDVYIPDVRKTPEGEIDELEKGIIRVEKIPEDLLEMYKGSFIDRSNAKSFIIVPLLTGNRIFGNLAFANYRKARKWSDELIGRIKLIAEIVGNGILRLRSHEALIEEMERRHMLEKKYTTIIKNASVGFMISDHDQNIQDVNDEYCRMSGFTRDELIKMKISDIDGSESPEKVDRDIAVTINGGIYHHQTSHIRKDGSVFDVDVHSQYSESEGFFFSFVRDVTELNIARKELEERLKFEELTSEFSAALVNVKIEKARKELDIWLKRFSELLNVDRCAIGEFSNDFSVYRFVCTYTNPALKPAPAPFSEIMNNDGSYGVEKYLVNGEHIKLDNPNDRLPEDLAKWKKEVLADGTKSVLTLPLISGETLLGSMFIATLTHEQKWNRALIRRLRLVAEIYANTLMRDRTDQELKNYQDHLERMVEERTARLEEAQNELVLNERMATLGRLTATVSHELRNPLGTIRASVYSVQRRLSGEDEKITNALDRAERNIKRCDLIIEELLNYSRVHDLKLETVSVDKWLAEVLEETTPPEGISVEKKFDAGVLIKMDRERFRRSMINILTNAYQSIQEKVTDEPGAVRVTTRKKMENLVIEISDNGVGFDMKIKDKLFEPLYSTKAFGVGLGIPITKQIIEQHGWCMDIAGKPQKGASVRITIPL